jgi:hypothetical protein
MPREDNTYSATVADGFVTIDKAPPAGGRVGLMGVAGKSDDSSVDVIAYSVELAEDEYDTDDETQIFNTIPIPSSAQLMQDRLPGTAWCVPGQTLRVKLPCTAAGQLTVFFATEPT